MQQNNKYGESHRNLSLWSQKNVFDCELGSCVSQCDEKMFENAYERTMRNEDYYANNPKDKGGETYRGIARNFHPSWKGWEIVDSYENKADLKNDSILEKMVKEFYRTQFFLRNHLEKIDCELLACKLFDIAVNAGGQIAGILFQRSLNYLGANLAVDGAIGQKTIQVYQNLNQKDKAYCLEIVCGLQIEFYVKITEKNPSQKVFSRGWLARV